MLWSTHPPDALPKPGDAVTITNSGQPLTVARRSKNKVGQVMLLVKDSQGVESLTMVETLNWWPAVGDLCTGLPTPYRQHLQSQLDDAIATGNNYLIKQSKYAYDDYNNAQSWLYGEFSVKAIDGDTATIAGARFSGTRQIPLNCLAVVRRPAIAALLEQSPANHPNAA